MADKSDTKADTSSKDTSSTEEEPTFEEVQAKEAEDRDDSTADIGAPGGSVKGATEGLVEIDKDGVPHAKGDTNALLTGVTSDIVNPAFAAPVDDDNAEELNEAKEDSATK